MNQNIIDNEEGKNEPRDEKNYNSIESTSIVDDNGDIQIFDLVADLLKEVDLEGLGKVSDDVDDLDTRQLGLDILHHSEKREGKTTRCHKSRDH